MLLYIRQKRRRWNNGSAIFSDSIFYMTNMFYINSKTGEICRKPKKIQESRNQYTSLGRGSSHFIFKQLVIHIATLHIFLPVRCYLLSMHWHSREFGRKVADEMFIDEPLFAVSFYNKYQSRHIHINKAALRKYSFPTFRLKYTHLSIDAIPLYLVV